MFPYAIDIQARHVDIEFEDKGRSSAKDLEQLNQEFLRKFNHYVRVLDGCTHITSGLPGNPYNMGPMHKRSMTGGQNNEVVFKGSGFDYWRSEEHCDIAYAKIPVVFKRNEDARRFPIVKNEAMKMDGAMGSHRFIGGLDIDRALIELENALAIIHSCDLAEVKRPELYPLLIRRPKELPVEEGGELNLLGKKEYCDQSFVGEGNGRVLRTAEFHNLAVYTYVCPKASFRVAYMKAFSNVMEGTSVSDTDREKKVTDFAKRLGSIVAAVHLNGGRFSESYVGRDGNYSTMSSLANTNVTTDGTPLDFDTVSFGHDGSAFIADDWIHAVNTLGIIATFYDDMSKPRPIKKVLDIDGFRIEPKAVGSMNLFGKSVQAFMQIQREIMKDKFVNPIKIKKRKSE